MLGIVALVVLAAAFSVALHVLAKARGVGATAESELVERVNRALPQTQCAQCGYAGCRPYAEAVVLSGEAINRCPPGGAEVVRFLGELLNQSPPPAPPLDSSTAPPLDSSTAPPHTPSGSPHAPPASLKPSRTPPTEAGAAPFGSPLAGAATLAVVDESECIGCALCLPACPVDAIVGAPGRMHTVLPNECTGCELCVAPCPVDCISMQAVPQASERTAAQVSATANGRTAQQADEPTHNESVAARESIALTESGAARESASRGSATSAKKVAPSGNGAARESIARAAALPCIHCGACDNVCPERLPAKDLYHSARRNEWSAAQGLGVDECTECDRCVSVCPSEIPLTDFYRLAKRELAALEASQREAERLRMRYEAHARRGNEARKLERAARDAARDAAKQAIKRKLKNRMSRSEERVA